MRTYSVFAPPQMSGTLEEDAQSLVFVRHGWSLAALFVPLIWMLVRRLWWVLLAYLVLVIGIQVLGLAVSELVTTGLSVAVAIVVFVEAGQLRLESMAAKGYREIAVLEARNRNEAERVFFTQWVADRGAVQPVAPSRPSGGSLHRPSSATPPALPGFSN
ncbi:MAG: DUF2628 domain-containing protein [Hyphomicrobiales bacterium]|jgi:hypothetical protein